MVKKYYAVRKGCKPGVFTSWADCQKQTSGYSGAEFKSFPDKFSAEQYVHSPDTPSENDEINTSGFVEKSLSVDAACSGNPGVMEYQGVDTKTGRSIFASKVYPVGTNNIGEFLAIVDALKYLHNSNDDRPIYSDSVTGIAWVRNKRVRTNLARSAKTEELFRDIDSAVRWLHEHTFKNPILKWKTEYWGESKADFGRK